MSKIEEERLSEINALIGEMTLEEKVSLMLHESMAVERLGIHEYNWWNECLHGVARAGYATVFPQTIGLAATFDIDLVQEEYEAISDEARAKYNEAQKIGDRRQFRGLTFWTPNVNIFRDPRWGRGQETFGEDPYLTSKMGVAAVRGLQGDDCENLKLAACAKHFAVHSGPELTRHTANVKPTKKDLWETYLPAFKACVDAGVESVMGAYQRLYDEPCNGSKFLLVDILRKKWGFKGHVVSDCWAVVDFHANHKVTNSPAESAALAINNGCDLNCGCTYHSAIDAVRQGLLSEEKINESLRRLFMTQFKLGMFDNPAKSKWANLSRKDVDTPENRQLARKVAADSIVLLKNKDGLLPVKKNIKKIFVVGPSATNMTALLGNYYGLNSKMVTILEGLIGKTETRPDINIDYHPGVGMYGDSKQRGWTVGMAESADLVVACFGIDSMMEGEEGDAVESTKGDRDTIELPKYQLDYLQAVHDRGTPVVLVLTGGAAIAFPREIADAIIQVWYPGEEGGNAVADVIFGDVVPSGHLPVTFPKSTEDLPDFEDYSMKGRTYRYAEKEPLYPFGFGLSYTNWKFGEVNVREALVNQSEVGIDSCAGGNKCGAGVNGCAGGNQNCTEVNDLATDVKVPGFIIETSVTNCGDVTAKEVVQVYISRKDRTADEALCSLKAFTKVEVAANEVQLISLKLPRSAFETVNDEGESAIIPGEYIVTVGDSSPSELAVQLGAAKPVSCVVKL